jgi:hypothetical protein
MREGLKAALEADPWKAEMLLYLRNLAGKFHYVSTQVQKIHERLDVLESVLMDGFRATGTAFNQMKTVTQAVVNETKSVKEDLYEFGGIIESSSYFDPNMRTHVV